MSELGYPKTLRQFQARVDKVLDLCDQVEEEAQGADAFLSTILIRALIDGLNLEELFADE